MSLIAACATPPDSASQDTRVPAREDATSAAIAEVYETQHSALTEPGSFVVRDSAAWLALWQRVHATVQPMPDAPAVSFADRMVIGLALGTQPTGGFQITIDSVSAAGPSLSVHAVKLKPGVNCLTTQALSSPVKFVSVPRRDGALDVRLSERTRSC